MAAELVRIPSRAGIDPVQPVIDFLSGWLQQKNLDVHRLSDGDGNDVGLYCHLRSPEPGPVLCLNACLDTAPFGNEDLWHHAPTSGAIVNDRLYGRGAADCKMAVAIFSHLAASFQAAADLPYGELFVVFDADEHTGHFNGIKNFLNKTTAKPDAVLIGYPGNNKLVIGSRGFLRATLTVYGEAAHSGASRLSGYNAVLKMAHLIARLEDTPLPEEEAPDFLMGPRLTVTEVKGGEGYSLVPDCCRAKIDFRLTPTIDQNKAAGWIESVIDTIDQAYPGPKQTKILWEESWPAYHLPAESPLVKEFLTAARDVFQQPVAPVVSGPSNIGNYLATKGIPALSGFGVGYANVHGTDESVELDTVMPVYEVYRRSIQNLLRAELSHSMAAG